MIFPTLIKKALDKEFYNIPYLDVTPKGKYIGNRHCHINSLSYALRHKKAKYILLCAQEFSNQWVAHCVVEMEDGTVIDPTYGNMVEDYIGLKMLRKHTIDGFEPRDRLAFTTKMAQQP
jgi:hypothetical protein